MFAIKQPYSINIAAEGAGVEALRVKKSLCGPDGTVIALARCAQDLYSFLKGDGKEGKPPFAWLKPLPTFANFVLVQVSGVSAESVAARLRKAGVLVRYFGVQGGALSNYIRISAGRPSDIKKLQDSLRIIDSEIQELSRSFSSSSLSPSSSCLQMLGEGGLPTQPQPQAILFDMDGVLADVSGSYRAAIIQTSAHFGVSVTQEDIVEAKANGNANNDWNLTHSLISKQNSSPPSFEEVKDYFQKLYLGEEGKGGLNEKETLLPSLDLLKSLAEGRKFKIGLVTGRPREEALTFLRRFDIVDLFDELVCDEDTALHKPDPAPVFECLKRLGGVKGGEAIMLGDTVDDMVAATASGVRAIGVLLPGKLPQGKEAWSLIGSGAACVLSAGLEALSVYGTKLASTPNTTAPVAAAASSTPSLRLIAGSDVLSNKYDLYRPAVTEETRTATNKIVQAVKREGEKELIKLSVQFGDLASPSTPYTYTKLQLQQAYESLPQETQELLQRSAARVKSFAQAQRNSLDNCMSSIPGGNAGHTILPLSSAGCYAPGGRYPLPSSVLMTAIPAKLAGCSSVVVCSPSPSDVTLAAAHVAEADFFFAVGGAQAIAAMAYGAGPIPRCDVVVGPGNKWVTAAKSIISGDGVAIDMLAGPSEVLVLADDTADAKLVAADLIAQAEHDEAAASVLVTTSSPLIKRVEEELTLQLAALSADVNRAVATTSLAQNGMAILVETIEEAVQISDRLAPEHLEIHTMKPALVAAECSNYGAVFIGSNAAEVTGDYCAGPNHVLPTGGTARCTAGLSVFTFLRARTWMSIYDSESARPLYQDAVALAKAEGLVGHGAAAAARISTQEEEKKEGEDSAVALPETIKQAPIVIKFAIPKGRMFDNVKGLLKEGGLSIKLANARVLRPNISLPGWDGKLLKPRDCVRMLDQGIRDIAFSGTDLLEELNASNVVPILDTGMDPIKLVAAAPAAMLKDGKIILPENRPLRIATEYVNSTRKWIEREKMFAVVVPTGGSTEVFPPEDADVIVDVSATGTTLRANQLIEYATVASSSTHLVASRLALEDPVKRVEIEMFQCLLASVLDARSKVLMEFNVSDEKDMERVLGSASLRGMCRPTVSPLDRGGFAVRVAVDRLKVPHLIFCVKENGGSDILVSNINNVVR